MSMFGNRKPPEAVLSQKGDGVQNAYNILGKGTQIIGDIQSDGDIRIDGSLKGKLDSRSKIILGPTSQIEGNIRSENMEIEGSVLGKIECMEVLFLKNGAQIDGDIYTKKLVVENGAVFNGVCHMGNSLTKSDVHDGSHTEYPQQI